jgi:hypothetical protein
MFYDFFPYFFTQWVSHFYQRCLFQTVSTFWGSAISGKYSKNFGITLSAVNNNF